jgi:DNA-binding response OmpR family regulator
VVERANVYTSGGLMVDDNAKKVTVFGEDIRLTPIEYKILVFLAKNKGKVYSIDQIYENIWNDISVRTDNTIAVHIRHIREKIEVDPREPKFLKVVWGVGYKIEDDRK